MIIECPSCKTKFSVDTAQVRSVKNPRFHCSRCDHFFEQSPAGEDKREQRSAKTPDPAAEQLPLLPESKPPKAKKSAVAPELTKEENLGITADWPDKPQTEVHTADLRQAVALSMVSKSRASQLESATALADERPAYSAQAQDAATRAVPTAAWPESTVERPAAAQIQSRTEVLKDDLAKRLSALAETHADAVLPEEPPVEDVPRPVEETTAWWEAPESSAPVIKPAPVRSPVHPAASMQSQKISSVVPFPDRAESAQAAAARDIPNGAFALGSPPTSPEPAHALSSSKFRLPRADILRHPLMVIGSFPAALCLGFFVWSLNINQTPQSIKQLLNLDTGALPRVPPPGVQVLDLASEMVTLDDGKQVLQISGNVFNGTTEPIKEVKVEASLYDQENHKLKNLVADSANGLLSAARLSSLDQHTLHNLQRQSIAPLKKLNPNEREPFKVIFTSPLEQAAWFTARVYSVKLS